VKPRRVDILAATVRQYPLSAAWVAFVLALSVLAGLVTR
jgi:hypothetical protein